jgi:predicted acyl esterase
MRPSPRLLVAAVAAASAVAGTALALPSSAATPQGVFRPAPVSQPLYGTKAPDADPERQRRVVEAADGVDLYVETWLPAAKGKRVPPKRVPTVLIMTPYVVQGQKRYGTNGRADVVEWFTQRGYAVAQAHVRGTGESGGCLEQTAAKQIDDGARVVEYLGRDAPWTNGSVGMYGISYDGETQISVAGLGDKRKTKYLKAIVPVASVSGQYEYSHFDGVPYAGQAALSNGAYLATTSLKQGETSTPQKNAQKLTCQPEVLSSSVTVTGDMTSYWKDREYRGGASAITAATLHVHGLMDWNVQPIAISGFFDRIPASTPRVGLYGLWEHNFPDNHPGVAPDTARADWLPMVTAWYDRWLKGARTGVEEWPTVQVQASDGTWRAERDFPGTGGPVGQLALGPEATLGASKPAGSTAFSEDGAVPTLPSSLVFTTPALRKPLHLTGQPVLDLWLTTDRPDGHLSTRVEVIGPDGELVTYDGGSGEAAATYGHRSLQHLQPIRENWFRQESSELAPVGVPIRVQVRHHPTDLLVPAGGRLRVTVAGSDDHDRNALSSGTGATITLLHDCAHPSALRFTTARPDAPRLDVLEVDEERQRGVSQARRTTDGGGLATARVCGKAPERLEAFVPTRSLVGRR